MKLFKISTIEVRIDRSFWLLPLFLSSWAAHDGGWVVGLRMFVLVSGIFFCVLAHEFCHSVRAMQLGIRVPMITLYPMGGVASMMQIPRRPWHEFSVAVVGPLFNFLLTGLLYFPLLGILGRENLFAPSLASWPQTVANIFWANPVLGFFNLIPAFPMDGGRMLRALLATKLSYSTATRISVMLGQFFAILFFYLGIVKHHWMLVLVGLYVFFAASHEMRRVRFEDESA